MAAALSALLVLFSHTASPGLLLDSDTSVLLKAIRAKNAPYSWFVSDWPLYNHFYRPIPTLTFEIDSRLYGNDPAGYGWTNAILAAFCVLALFWLLKELINRPLAAASGALLFASWQWAWPQIRWDFAFAAIIPITLIVGAIRHRKAVGAYIPAALVGFYLIHELTPMQALAYRIVDWCPGRTASTMTIFTLVAMAAYARYERLGKAPPPPEITPLTPPATRSSEFETNPGIRWPWAILAIASAALAFGCYEQAVMLPACLLGLAVFFALKGYKPNWPIHLAFWSLILGYVAIRHVVIPPGNSHYQVQQIRSTQGAWNTLLGFAWPLNRYADALIMLQTGWQIIFINGFYPLAFSAASFVQSVVELRKDWQLALTGWTLSVLAFLPMAWLHFFAHYYYWPMALRTILVIALVAVWWRLTSTAIRPPEIETPTRTTPAPGSLTA
jgi:hypothetical protein